MCGAEILIIGRKKSQGRRCKEDRQAALLREVQEGRDEETMGIGVRDGGVRLLKAGTGDT